MAETVKQGVEYEISAKDSTSPAVDSATKKVEDAAKKAASASKSVSQEFQGRFNPMATVTAALSGNLQGVGQQLLGLVSRMKGVHMSMMKFGLYAALVGAIAKGVMALIEHFRSAARQAEEIKLGNAERALKSSAEQSAALAAGLAEAKKNADALVESMNRQLDALVKLTSAQNEYAKAQELALANSDEERRLIEKRFEDISRINSEEEARERRRIKAAALADEAGRLGEEKENAEDDAASARDSLAEAQRKLAALNKKARIPGLGMIWGAMFGDDDTDQQIKRWAAVRDQAQKDLAAANAKIKDIDRKSADIQERRSMLEAEELADNYHYAAEEQKVWNQEWKEFEETRKAEIEEVKEAAERAAEEVKEKRVAAEKAVKDERMAAIRETAAAEADAARRLSAAQSAVRQAWGWYRDKGSLKAQLEEEKADAAAQSQFEKDFEKLRFRRDWREAKNLSLDQEAVRRVALAREEEKAAQEYAKVTAEASQRAAESLENIEKSFAEVG
jgi:hypothetical protein